MTRSAMPPEPPAELHEGEPLPGEVVRLAPLERILSRETRPLPVPLSPAELRSASRTVGRLLRERAAADYAFAEVRAEHKAAQASAEAEITLLARMLDTETADRPIECLTWANLEAGTAETRRVDTGEVLWSRPLTDNERQEELFRDAPPPRPPRRGRRAHPEGEGLER